MIAVWDDTDQWHSGAKAAYDLLFSQGRKLVTTPWALYECGNASARRTGTGTSVVCSVVPMLSVRNGARAVEFYKSAFGAIEVYRVEGSRRLGGEDRFLVIPYSFLITEFCLPSDEFSAAS